jgi:hypothetical protein
MAPEWLVAGFAVLVMGAGLVVLTLAACKARPPLPRVTTDLPSPAAEPILRRPHTPFPLSTEAPPMPPEAKHPAYTRAEVETRIKALFPNIDPAKLAAFVTKLLTIFVALLPLIMGGTARAGTHRLLSGLLEAAEEIDPDPSVPARMRGTFVDPIERDLLTKGLASLIALAESKGGAAIDAIVAFTSKYTP